MGVRDYFGVEPVLFLYMMAFNLNSVIEESFFMNKICRVNFGLPANVCDNLGSEENTEHEARIQVSVSTFYQWYNIVSHGIPVLLSFFMGAWSDRVGRKLPLLIGLTGQLLYYIMMAVNSLQENWRVELVLWTSCLPNALCGGALTVFMACFSYLSDTTTPAARTLRTTFLEAAYVISMPLGVSAGSGLFNGIAGRSYTVMFNVGVGLMVAAWVYTALVLLRRTAEPGGSKLSSCWCGLLNWSYLVDTFATLLKFRPHKRRRYLFLLLVALCFYTFQRDESHIMYLYTQQKFNWEVSMFSSFRTLQTSLFLVGLLVGVPVLVKLLKLRDSVCLMVGSVCQVSARIFYICASQPWLMYVGCAVATLGPISASIIRSMVSKLVPASERGKALATLSIADTCAPMLSGLVYGQVYNHTLKTYLPAFFFVTIASQAIVFLIALYISTSMQGVLTQAEENEDRSLPKTGDFSTT